MNDPVGRDPLASESPVSDPFAHHPLGGRRDDLERRLDDLVRPSLVVEPPPGVHANLLATVLRAADAVPFAPPVSVTVAAPPALGAGLSPLAYAAVATVIAAYLALVGLVGTFVADWEWLPVLVRQLGAAASLVAGPSGDGLLGTVLPRVMEQAPWLALTPLLWLLWERDRAAPGRR